MREGKVEAEERGRGCRGGGREAEGKGQGQQGSGRAGIVRGNLLPPFIVCQEMSSALLFYAVHKD